MILMMAFCLPVTAKAASGSLQLSALSETVSKGSQVTVVCQVASAESFADVSFRLSYDDSILTFLSGGKKVSGGNGMLEIASTGNTAEVPKKTFSLQFKAKKKGTTIIRADGDISVTNASGEKFSMWSNQVAVSVVKKKKKTGNTEVQTTPKATNDGTAGKIQRKSSENAET
mgnify:CR=1 FL=1